MVVNINCGGEHFREVSFFVGKVSVCFRRLVAFFCDVALFSGNLRSFAIRSCNVRPSVGRRVTTYFVNRNGDVANEGRVFCRAIGEDRRGAIFQRSSRTFTRRLNKRYLVAAFARQLGNTERKDYGFRFLGDRYKLFDSENALFLVLFPLFYRGVFANTVLVFVDGPDRRGARAGNGNCRRGGTRGVHYAVEVGRSRRTGGARTHVTVRDRTDSYAGHETYYYAGANGSRRFGTQRNRTVSDKFHRAGGAKRRDERHSVFRLLIFNLGTSDGCGAYLNGT